MTERQKRVLIIAGILILILLLWLMGRNKNTVVQTPNGPVEFGGVNIPGITFPPRTTGGIDIPGLNLGRGFGYGASTCMCDGGITPTPFVPTTVQTMASPSPVMVTVPQAPHDFYGVYNGAANTPTGGIL